MFRFEEQLQQWLALEPLDSVSIPLFVPSTLLSMPEILVPKQCPRASAASRIQVLSFVLLPYYCPYCST